MGLGSGSGCPTALCPRQDSSQQTAGVGTGPGSKPLWPITERRWDAHHSYSMYLCTGSSTARAEASSSYRWWQEASDGMGQGDSLPFPLCGAGELWVPENDMFSNQSTLYSCPGLCVSPALCGDLLGTSSGAVWPRTGNSSHSLEMFQERNEESCYGFAVFSWQLTSHPKAEGSCSSLVCAVSLLPGDRRRFCVGAARLQHCVFPPRAGSG